MRHLTELPFRGGNSKGARLGRYAVAVALALLAWLVTLALGAEFDAASRLPFAAAVALATWYGGSGPGVLTAALSIFAIDFSFLPPIGSIELTHSEELVDSFVFLIVALTIGATTAAMRRARELAERRALDVEEMNAELEQQVDQIQALSRESERLAAQAQQLLDVTTALAEAGSVDDVANVILTKGMKAVEATRAFLMLVDGDQVERLGASGYPEDMRRRTRLTIADDGPVAEAIRTRSPVWLSTVDEFRARYPKVYDRVGAVSDRQAHVVAPLRYGNEVVGALGLSFSEPSAVGAADRTFTLLLTQSAAAALQRARSYDAERERRREAELTARAREQVLGVVAHDLRNPLHLAMATTELLGEPTLAEERRTELLAVMTRAVTHMRRLVADLLDAVRIQAGRLSLDFENVTLGSIIDQAEEMGRPLAAERRIKLEAHATDRSLRLRVDRARVLQVLGNLLGNAVKFTAEGGRITLDGHIENGAAVFSVRDTGVGIAPERLPHVFEQFWQGNSGDNRGVGLGLAIAKAIVEAHGGTIDVQSAVGKGSTFSICFPVAARGQATSPQVPRAQAVSS
ncbi:MAG TPA: ATP-binding protein [Gemmatimonadaceae bacterium]